MTPNLQTQKSAAEFKRRVYEVVSIALNRFYEETGITPSDIDIQMIEVTSRGEEIKRFVLGNVTIGFDL